MRERQERAYGPYRRGNTWRVVEVATSGARTTASFESEARAREHIADYNDEATGRTVSGCLDLYVAHMRTKGLAASTVITNDHRLRAILRVVERDRILSHVTVKVAPSATERANAALLAAAKSPVVVTKAQQEIARQGGASHSGLTEDEIVEAVANGKISVDDAMNRDY